MLPQHNARIVKVERAGGTSGGGFTADYDRPATDPEGAPEGAGADAWAGDAPAYYMERRERVLGAETRSLITRRSLIVSSRKPEVEFREEDTVRFTFRGEELSGVVEAVEERQIPGVPGSTRLTFVSA